MIDVTATMFPSTVRNDRSLFDQIASRAMPAASRNWCMICRYRLLLPAGVRPGGLFDLDRRAVAQLADRAEWPDDHLIAHGHARRDLEVLLAGDADLHRAEVGIVVVDVEHDFELLSH